MREKLSFIYNSIVDISPLVLLAYFVIIAGTRISNLDIVIQIFVLFLYLNKKIDKFSK